ncbi:hypothetical protein B1757_14280 [Acidithiobacillus marinus]|uniref:Uncharacterized protein n=1 Tax=Acidithiobacillus marinus TaxID=187490 RepID=A0A2I1DI24_9PROT|nr:hypothetical protein B1757_14280 [Acidithiobacillus marinus]
MSQKMINLWKTPGISSELIMYENHGPFLSPIIPLYPQLHRLFYIWKNQHITNRYNGFPQALRALIIIAVKKKKAFYLIKPARSIS